MFSTDFNSLKTYSYIKQPSCTTPSPFLSHTCWPKLSFPAPKGSPRIMSTKQDTCMLLHLLKFDKIKINIVKYIMNKL